MPFSTSVYTNVEEYFEYETYRISTHAEDRLESYRRRACNELLAVKDAQLIISEAKSARDAIEQMLDERGEALKTADQLFDKGLLDLSELEEAYALEMGMVIRRYAALVGLPPVSMPSV